MNTKKEPAKTKGTTMAEKTRAAANRMTDEQRDAALSKALQVIYRDGKKECVNRG